ncbi:MAG: PGF-pre-PGF domain-containing protein [Candidatus Micrarchaeia archaeon]
MNIINKTNKNAIKPYLKINNFLFSIIFLFIVLISLTALTVNAQTNTTYNNTTYKIRNITLNTSIINKYLNGNFLNTSDFYKILNLSSLKNFSFTKNIENYINTTNIFNYNIISDLINSNLLNSNSLCTNCINITNPQKFNITNIGLNIIKNNEINNINYTISALGTNNGITFNLPINNTKFIKNFSSEFNYIIQNKTPIANIIFSNTILIKKFISNYTPAGFALLNSTINSIKNNNSTLISWSMISGISNSSINVSAVKNIANNLTVHNLTTYNSLYKSIYAKILLNYFNNTNNIEIKNYHIIYAISNITGDNDIIKYIPANITVLEGKGGTALAEISGIEKNISTHIIIENKNIIIKNITINPKESTKSISTMIQELNNSEFGKIFPNIEAKFYESKISPIEFFYINSSLSDSAINYVNYTFSITKSFLKEYNINTSYIQLFRYYTLNNSWIALPTKIVGENLTDYIYKAQSPGISIYVVGYKGQEQIPQNQQFALNTTLSTPPQNGINDLEYIIAIIAVIIGLIILIYIIKNSKKSN